MERHKEEVEEESRKRWDEKWKDLQEQVRKDFKTACGEMEQRYDAKYKAQYQKAVRQYQQRNISADALLDRLTFGFTPDGRRLPDIDFSR